jgi:hypothetical protein
LYLSSARHSSVLSSNGEYGGIRRIEDQLNTTLTENHSDGTAKTALFKSLNALAEWKKMMLDDLKAK